MVLNPIDYSEKPLEASLSFFQSVNFPFVDVYVCFLDASSRTPNLCIPLKNYLAITDVPLILIIASPFDHNISCRATLSRTVSIDNQGSSMYLQRACNIFWTVSKRFVLSCDAGCHNFLRF